MPTVPLATDEHPCFGMISVAAGVRPWAMAVRIKQSMDLKAIKGGLPLLSSSL